MTSKFQLELLRILRKRTGLAKAFTLIELLIVVAIVGLLAAIGIPKFLDIRANAEAGAKVGEIVGLGKECGVYLASGGLGTRPTYTALPVSGGQINICLPAGGKFERVISKGTTKVKCINEESTKDHEKVTVTVSSDGELTCAFS